MIKNINTLWNTFAGSALFQDLHQLGESLRNHLHLVAINCLQNLRQLGSQNLDQIQKGLIQIQSRWNHLSVTDFKSQIIQISILMGIIYCSIEALIFLVESNLNPWWEEMTTTTRGHIYVLISVSLFTLGLFGPPMLALEPHPVAELILLIFFIEILTYVLIWLVIRFVICMFKPVWKILSRKDRIYFLFIVALVLMPH